MEIKHIADKALLFIKKYKYAALVLIIGLALMMIPGGKETDVSQPAASVKETSAEDILENKLSVLLTQVEGAGQVRVILTVSAGTETMYQTNDDISSSGDSSNARSDTVTVTDASRNQQGLIKQINPAIFRGAVIICQGADDPNVQLAMVDAVSKLTGLGANRISVLKMK